MLTGIYPVMAAWGSAAEQFGGYGTGAGQFVEPFGAAVDQANGDLYVLDTNDNRVEKFASDGKFLLAWGWGVADGRTHVLQTCTKRCFRGFQGSGVGELAFAEGVAVNDDPASQSYGDVYVVDIFNHRVQVFTPTGRFVMMFGAGVNKTAHSRHDVEDEDICPVHPNDRCGAGAQGVTGGQLEFPVEGHFIDVGLTGTVYIGERNRVQEFAPNGTYLSQVALPRPETGEEGEAGGVSGLAVDAAGDLFVIRIGVRGVNEYEASGKPLRTFDEQEEPENPEGPVPVVALDSAGDVFVDYNGTGEHRFDEYDPAGAMLATFGIGIQGGLHGVAYGDAVRGLYVLETGEFVGVRIVPVPAAWPFAGADSELARWLIPEL
jgi:tripartite motif-containing protein 71